MENKMNTILLPQDNHKDFEHVKNAIERQNIITTSGDEKDTFSKADHQKYDAISIFFDDEVKKVFKLVDTIRKSRFNYTTPILLFTDNFDEAAQVFTAIKNFHLIDCDGSAEHLIQKINTALKGPHSERKKISLDASIINIFAKATINTLDVMGNLRNIEHQKPFLYEGDLPFGIDVSGFAAINSDHFKGFLSLNLPEQTLLKLAETMLNTEYDEINDEINDMASELNNVIYGQAKKQFSQLGFNLPRLIPIIVKGEETIVRSLSSGPSIVIPFTSSAGPFLVSVSLGQLERPPKVG